MPVVRDLRTAHEKWEQGMAEARKRGYWYQLETPLPEFLLGGWDHTKNHTRKYRREFEVQISSRGRIPPNIRDDTRDGVEITVTTYPPIPHTGSPVDQIMTRGDVIKGVPKGRQEIMDPRKFDEQVAAMPEKSGWFKHFHFVGGPRWNEWLAWDNEFVWRRFLNNSPRLTGYNQAWNATIHADVGYRQVRLEMERQAAMQGITSWTRLTFPKFPQDELQALRQRFANMMCQHRLVPRTWHMVKMGLYYMMDSYPPHNLHGFSYDGYEYIVPKSMLDSKWWQDWSEETYRGLAMSDRNRMDSVLT